MTTLPTPGDVLREARRRDSQTKRKQVLAAIDNMLTNNEKITFAAVAQAAGVSRWLVYADGMREHVENARRRQNTRSPRQAKATGATVSPAGLQVELELLRQENSRLRAEERRLKEALRRHLGQQLDQVGAADLAQRVQELTTENQRLSNERDSARTENAKLAQQLNETEDDLAAARLSIRRMIRYESTTSSTG
ncbi:DUF6262 family protein (plasmid) [Streptosporangium sp. CA-135522]|uniref:DUF6262 family protein n=1 Tax=Streptosporangium sp. CA-135522 TaxID=3240072 RepID=UPI003D8B5C53